MTAGMKRRLFLKSAALGGGAALGGRRGARSASSDGARAARAAALGLLERAGLTPAARLARYDGARPGRCRRRAARPGGTARGQLGDATWSCALRVDARQGRRRGRGDGAPARRRSRRDVQARAWRGDRGRRRARARLLALVARATTCCCRAPATRATASSRATSRTRRGSRRPPTSGPTCPTSSRTSRGSTCTRDRRASRCSPPIWRRPPSASTRSAAKLGVLVLVEPVDARRALVAHARGERRPRARAPRARRARRARGRRVRRGQHAAAVEGSRRGLPRGRHARAAPARARLRLPRGAGPLRRARRRAQGSDGPDGAAARAAVLGGLQGARGARRPAASSRTSGRLLGRRARGRDRVAERLVRRPRDDVAAAGVRRAARARARAAHARRSSSSRRRRPSGFFRSICDGEALARRRSGATTRHGRRRRTARPRRGTRGRWHLVRRSADALTFAAKQLLVMQRQEPGFEARGALARRARPRGRRLRAPVGSREAARTVRRRRDGRPHRGRLDVGRARARRARARRRAPQARRLPRDGARRGRAASTSAGCARA